MLKAVLAVGALAVARLVSADFYVSPNGNDNNSGNHHSPFATLGRAQQGVRDYNGDMTKNMYVYVAPATYYLPEPLVFTAEDSGSNGYRVIWQATDPVNGANISGGIQVTDWSAYDSSNGIYQAPVPTGAKSRHFFVNQQHAQRARTQISRSALTLVSNGFDVTDSGTQYITSLSGIDDGELRAIGSFTDRYMPIDSVSGNTLIMANPAFNNNIIGYDTFTNPNYDGGLFLENVLALLTDAGEYFLDQNNDIVYYMPQSGQSMADQYAVLPMMEQVLIIAGTLDQPVHDLTFQGFNYMHTTWNYPSSNVGYVDQQTGGYIGLNETYDEFEASRPFWWQVPGSVQASAANNISFRNGSMVALMGGFGIGNDPNAHASPGIGLGVSNTDITGMVFHQTGANAITVGGIQANAHHPSDVRMTNEYIIITENIFFDQQYTISSGVPILSTYTSGSKITHNDISNVPYSGICWGYGWGSNDAGGSPEYQNRGLYNYQPIYQTPTTLKNGLIAYNLLNDYGTIHTDLGGIYTLSASPSTYINNNWVYSYSGWAALYHDEGSRGYIDSVSVFQNGGGWLTRNEYSTSTTGNLTLFELYINNGPTNDGTNSYGDNIYNNTEFDDYGSLPYEYQNVCYLAGIPPSERGSRPVSNNPSPPQ